MFIRRYGVPLLEAACVGALALLSILATLPPPVRSEHVMLWIAATVLIFVIYLAARVAQIRMATREQEAAQSRAAQEREEAEKRADKRIADLGKQIQEAFDSKLSEVAAQLAEARRESAEKGGHTVPGPVLYGELLVNKEKRAVTLRANNVGTAAAMSADMAPMSIGKLNVILRSPLPNVIEPGAAAETPVKLTSTDGTEVVFDERQFIDAFAAEHLGAVWDRIAAEPSEVPADEIKAMVKSSSSTTLTLTYRGVVKSYRSIHTVYFSLRRVVTVFERREDA
jgi:hypothetical protein